MYTRTRADLSNQWSQEAEIALSWFRLRPVHFLLSPQTRVHEAGHLLLFTTLSPNY